MKLFEKYALKEVSENELSIVLCRIEEFIYSVAKNIADKDLAFSYRDFNEDELGSLYTFLMDEDIPYIEDKIGDIITIRSDSVWKEILKHKALKNPGRAMVMRLYEEIGTCDEYSEIIGVIDFGKDGCIEREQFKTILEKNPKLKNYTFDPIELLDKGYTKAKESRHTQLSINDFDFFKLGDFD